MMSILLPLSLPALHNLGLSLGLIDELENNAPRLPLAFMKPSIAEAMGVVGTIILWSMSTFIGSRLPQLSSLRAALAMAPVLLALTLTASVPSDYALPVCLGVLSISLIAAEVMTLFSAPWATQSEASWTRFALLQRDPRNSTDLLLMGRMVVVGSLMGLTGLAICLGWSGRLPERLLPTMDAVAVDMWFSGWPRLVAVLIWLWPSIAFLSVRMASPQRAMWDRVECRWWAMFWRFRLPVPRRWLAWRRMYPSCTARWLGCSGL